MSFEQEQKISDDDIQALVDNELPWDQEKTLRSLIEHDPAADKRYKELLHQKILLRLWYGKNAYASH